MIVGVLPPKGEREPRYLLGEGDGLDTREAAEQRRDTLEFIEAHLDICSGEIEMGRSMGLTICRKKARPAR